MRAYKNIEYKESEVKSSKTPVIKKKNLHILGLFLVVCLSFSCLGISLSSLGLSTEVKHILSSWSPNITDLGKLKFVTGELSEEAIADIESLELPFNNNYITEVSGGVFQIDGLGGMMVKACMNGKVQSIEREGDKKTITIAHSNNLKTVYSGIDTLGVKEGDGVNKNTPLGVSLSSKIIFKILYRNKAIAGLTVSNGEFSFL